MNKELDCLIIGFSVGSLASLWFGYWLRGRVEDWRYRRSMKRSYAKARAADTVLSIKQVPEQRARQVLSGKPRVIPLPKRDPEVGHEHHRVERPIPLPCDSFHEPGSPSQQIPPADALLRDLELDKQQAKETARIIREDAVAALTGAGYKRAAAEAALDACTLVERAGGLESWVACALRRAAAKP